MPFAYYLLMFVQLKERKINMQKIKTLIIVYLIILLIFPYAVYLLVDVKTPKPSDNRPEICDMEVLLYRHKNGTVTTVSCFDYLCATLAGEMNSNSPTEALKAQTVACFTYMLNKMNYVLQNPKENIGHNGGYVCDDSSHCMAYLEKSDAREKWGDSYFEKYYPNIENAVLSVIGEMITFDSKPINAVFHSMSNGSTHSALEVWGTDVSYLQPSDCSNDKNENDYLSTVTFSSDDFKNVFFEQLGVTLPESPELWIGDIHKTDTGLVKQITVSDTLYSGTHIRTLFSLRSASFDVEYKDNNIVFTVYGYGHGVGMSQRFACSLANEGYSYRKILQHFYKNTEIENYKI